MTPQRQPADAAESRKRNCLDLLGQLMVKAN